MYSKTLAFNHALDGVEQNSVKADNLIAHAEEDDAIAEPVHVAEGDLERRDGAERVADGGVPQCGRLQVYAHSVTTGWLDALAVGTLTVWSDGVNFAWLDDLAVHPDHRRRGIGSRLVVETRSRLASAGVPAVQVMPIPGREQFFARHGFVVQENATVMDLGKSNT